MGKNLLLSQIMADKNLIRGLEYAEYLRGHALTDVFYSRTDAARSFTDITQVKENVNKIDYDKIEVEITILDEHVIAYRKKTEDLEKMLNVVEKVFG